MNNIIKKYHPEIIASFACLALGMLSGYVAHAGDSEWYATLAKPPFNPPSWIFAPVWTMLYLMMGVALGKLWKEKSRNTKPLILFALQFIFNLAWSPLFFYFHRIDLALYDICLLVISLATLRVLTRNNRTIFLLLLPYALWTSFALLLNYSIYTMNSI